MSRIPVIPGGWAAQKVASLYCDDAAHYTATGEPKLTEGSSQEERECCVYRWKLLLADKAEKRFCIVHDTGVGNVSKPSGQWWAFDSANEVHRAKREYLERMSGQGVGSNWWVAFGTSILAFANVPPGQPKATSGLTNKISVSVPAGLKPTGDAAATEGGTTGEASASDPDETWEVVKHEDDDEYDIV